MNLAEALHLELPTTVAITGGGGKTTTLRTLGEQLSGKVWESTTTHLGTDQLDIAEHHFRVEEVNQSTVAAWLQYRTCLLTGDFTPDDRVHGPTETQMTAIYQAACEHRVSLVLEADGSRSRPLKAPGINEPATPAWSRVVITVVGLSVLGSPFGEETVHRVQPYAEITGSVLGDPITLTQIVKLLVSPQGGLKNNPPASRKIVLFNQADTEQLRGEVRECVAPLLEGGFDQVLIGSYRYLPQRWLSIE
jgi:probable selenium-dependent hydroxylase accessory protein YqeC